MTAQRVYLNNDWGFTEEYSEELFRLDYDGSRLENVRLPHTCKETPFHYFDEHIYQMVSGYRKVLAVPEEWRGKKLILTIDGAAHESEVFVNGEKVGEHHCGYTAFSMDIGEKLHYGEQNTLVVKVDSRETANIPPFGFVVDYMTYGGIYRDVYLDIKNEHYLQDVFVTTKIPRANVERTTDRGKVISQITLNAHTKGLSIRQSIKKKEDDVYRELGEHTVESDSAVVTLEYSFPNVMLWDLEHPELYDLKIELLLDGVVQDEKIVTFGFRRAEFRASGFYLNDRRIKLRGLNRHQSYPYVGYAMPKSMQKRDADILKNELGLNAVRTSHYPQSHYFLDRCDEIGLLVFTEMPGWQHIGDEKWKTQAVENVRDMVLQYRNHTSIILWGVRINESQDDDEFY